MVAPRPIGTIVGRWSGDSPVYAELARVMRYSAQKACPRWTVDVQQVDGPSNRYDAFMMKVSTWSQAVDGSENGSLLALLDVDTIITNALDPVADLAFDVAITVRPGRVPLNSGVVFVRVSDAVRAFMRRWLRRTIELRRGDKTKRYSDQDALVELTRKMDPALQLARLRCLDWNCEQSHWAAFDPARTKIVHFKSDARKFVFYGGTKLFSPGARRIVDLFRDYQAEAP